MRLQRTATELLPACVCLYWSESMCYFCYFSVCMLGKRWSLQSFSLALSFLPLLISRARCVLSKCIRDQGKRMPTVAVVRAIVAKLEKAKESTKLLGGGDGNCAYRFCGNVRAAFPAAVVVFVLGFCFFCFAVQWSSEKIKLRRSISIAKEDDDWWQINLGSVKL